MLVDLSFDSSYATSGWWFDSYCVFVCVCKRERERGKEWEIGIERGIESKKHASSKHDEDNI